MSASTPLLAQVVRHICYTMIEAGLTLGDVGLFLFDDALRQKITATISNQHTRLFWEQFNRKTPRDRAEYTNSTTNKLTRFLPSPCSQTFSAKRSTINLQQITQDGRILLLLLNQQFQEASRLVGNIVLTRLLLSAFARLRCRRESHHPLRCCVMSGSFSAQAPAISPGLCMKLVSGIYALLRESVPQPAQ